MHIPRCASWLDEFRKEIMALPVGKHDDQIDALSQALDRAFRNPNFMYTGPLKGLIRGSKQSASRCDTARCP